jgi:hypothetical protein
VNHVRSGGRIDGDGGVVGRHVLETSGRHGRTYASPKTILEKKIFIVTGSRRVGDDGRHVDQGSPC